MLTIIALTGIVVGRTDHSNWIALSPLNIAHRRRDSDIFVDLGPMHATPLAYESPILALLRGGIAQSREPL